MYHWNLYPSLHNLYTFNLEGFTCATSPSNFTTPYILVERSTSDNQSCSKRAAYDTVGNTLRISPRANMNCSENMAYGMIANTSKKSSVEDISTSHTAVYVEVLPSNNWSSLLLCVYKTASCCARLCMHHNRIMFIKIYVSKRVTITSYSCSIHTYNVHLYV